MPYVLCLVCAMPANASDCIQFKKTPTVNISAPIWNKSVVQPLAPMDLLHGVVIATFSEEYSLTIEANPVSGGYCVVLSAVDANVGYTEFLVKIDSRNRPGSCAYDAILAHEQMHISAHLSVLDDSGQDIMRSVAAAANSIMPIFVPAGDGFDRALDLMQRGMQAHPDIVLMKRKINAENEIRNRRIDMQDDGRAVRACLEK